MKRKPADKALESSRPLRERLLLAVVASIGYVFSFVIFGILDQVLHNRLVLPFSLGDVLRPVVLAGLLGMVLLGGGLMLLRARWFDRGISLVCGFLIAGYLQAAFLNLPLGQLTGDAIDWGRYSAFSVFELLLFVGIVSLPFWAYRYLPKAWKGLMLFIPALLVGMQLAGLAVGIAELPPSEIRGTKDPRAERYLSTEGCYEVSSGRNVLIFIVDRMDTQYIREVRQREPAFFDRLDGFTYYDNNLSQYGRTFPSVASMLTGQLFYYDAPAEEYFGQAWSSATFLPALRQAGFTTKLYMEKGYTYTDIDQIAGVADNVAYGRTRPRMLPAMQELLRLSCFRYAPHVFKPFFWLTPGVFDAAVEATGRSPVYQTDDFAFGEGLKKNGLTTQSQKDNFTFIHLNGCHAPLSINERAELVTPLQTSVVQQTMGCFSILYDYMDRMKELGLYQDATIIITGDHGISDDFTPLDSPKLTALFVKPAGSAGAVLATSHAPVSLSQLRATVLRSMGIEPLGALDQGPAIDEIPEDAQLTRRFHYRVDRPDYSEGMLQVFDVDADADRQESWHLVEELPLLYPHG